MASEKIRKFQIVFSESNSSDTRTYDHAGSFESAKTVARAILGGGVRGEAWVRIDEQTSHGLEYDVFNLLAGR